jgi:hypothetical protein
MISVQDNGVFLLNLIEKNDKKSPSKVIAAYILDFKNTKGCLKN